MRRITPSQVAILTEAVSRYSEASWLADDFLARRGIAESAASTFRLGVVTDPEPEHARFEGWLSIPYLGYSEDGVEECWGVRFRCIEDHKCSGHGKYQGLAETPTRMFNVRAIDDADFVIHVTEGELDCVILNQLGLNAVAIPGANNWKYHYYNLLNGFNKVFIWGDPDAAGAEFSAKLTRIIPNSAAVRLEVGDVNDTYLDGGRAAVMAAMEAVKWA